MHEDTEPQQEGCYLPGTGFNRDRYVQRPYFFRERPAPTHTTVIPASTWDFDTPENRANAPYRNEYENGICKIVETIEKTPCERFLEIRQTKNFGTSSRSVYKRVKIYKEIDDSINNDSYLTLGTLGDAVMPTGVTTLPLSAGYIEDKLSENLEMIGSNKIPKNPPKLPTYVSHRETYQQEVISDALRDLDDVSPALPLIEEEKEEPLYLANLTDELREELQAYYDKTFPHF